MPYPTEHAARVRDPGDFIATSFRSKSITSGVRIIVGKLKDGDGAMVTQAYRFAASQFTAAEARKWLKDHDVSFISFEEATGEDDAEEEASAREDKTMYVKLDEVERRCLPRATAELRLSGKDGSRKIAGYAAVFDTWADIGGWFRESIRKGAFAKTIKENDVRALLNHDPNYVLGRNKAGTLRMKEDKHGLAVEIDPTPTTWANDLIVSMERGDVNQMSFGFSVNKQQVDYEKDERVLEDVTLFDVSVVTFPAYPTTSAEVRSAFANKGKPPTYSSSVGSITVWSDPPNSTWSDSAGKTRTIHVEADITNPDPPGFSELDRIVRKIKAKEELTEDEVRVISAYLPDLSVPPAQHTETPPEPPAQHSAGDTRKGSVADLLIRTAIATSQPSRKEVAA